ncbi:MAG: sigma-54-dependent Fis family transcriptional regulator, partial [Deltaproteobacteria bacterium]|nr:sigma-54-dependent Fis family transcriptional regulator [Deltaproteobacteria bacterium]
MIPKQPILIVDDDPSILELLERRFTSAGFSVLTASDGFQALDTLKEQDAAAIVADIKMPGMDGMELLKEVRSRKPELPIIFITAYGTIPDAVEFLKAGAVDYIPKPFDGRQLLDKVNKLIDRRETLNSEKFYEGPSPKMKELEDLTKRVTASDVSLLILGESGVGKERIARFIHQNGRRGNRPFTV